MSRRKLEALGVALQLEWDKRSKKGLVGEHERICLLFCLRGPF